MKIDRMERSLKLMQFDVEYRCFGSIAGMDEVGRGPFAGNVVAACVMMPEAPLIEGIDDSKKISEKRREELYERIMEVALHVGIGQIGPEEIDRINILQATRKAMEQAASRIPAEVFLSDAVTGLQLKGHQMPLIKGDARSYHIAAASIVARDIYFIVNRIRQRTAAAIRPIRQSIRKIAATATKKALPPLKRYQTG